MARTCLTLFILAALAVPTVLAQGGPGDRSRQPDEERYEGTRSVVIPSAKELIFLRARAEAEQRRARIAARKWYGYYPSRPTANPLPMTSRYGMTHRSHAWMMYYGAYRHAARPVIIIR